MRSGVSRYRDRWRADLRANNTVRCLGVFATRDEAENAYIAAQVDLHKARQSL